jgi:FMN phosphatase YigB (HAD superfamily)
MEVFDSSFYPALGLEKRNLQPTLDLFYAEDFPKLKNLTQYRPAAVELIIEAMRRGFQLGVATNPLFPRTAIEQRLAWAGLAVEDFPFVIIPSFDTFHFAKPNPAYFAEFLGQMGWPEDSVIMVGNDSEKDILAARQAGLSVFWAVADEDEQWLSPQEAPPKGKLEAFFNWLDSVPAEVLEPRLNTPTAIVAVLRATPAVLDDLCADQQVDSWTRRPEPDEWSPTEILCHLRDVEVEVNLPRIEKILQEVNPFITGKDTDHWAVERDYIRQDGPSALDDFTAYRQKLLFVIDNLSADAWQRPARHAFFGPTHLTEVVDILAKHDRLHIKQIQQTYKKLTEIHASV